MTPSKTAFAHLERLGPGDPLSSDGYVFQDGDRAVIDRLLRVGAILHRHDAHAALIDPTAAPVISNATSGGRIPSSTAIYVTYTLIDADGGETGKAPVQTLVTPPGYDDPSEAPTVAVSHVAGSLLAGNNSYAITVTDGLGGETALGPPALAVIDQGFPSAEVDVTNLDAAMNTASGGAGGAAWRLWRSKDGGPWYLMATGTGDSFLDDGTVAGDCTVAPPSRGTTQGANELTVTVPGGQPAGTVNFSIYASLDGSFTNPALLSTLPIADAGVAQVFTTLALLSGAPPSGSQCVGGANLIDAVTEITNMARSVAIIDSNPQAGDYTFQQTDVGIVVEATGSSPQTFTIPLHATVPFPVGATIEVFQEGTGAVDLAGVGGVTLRSDSGRTHLGGQYATAGLRQRAIDEWVLSGDLS